MKPAMFWCPGRGLKQVSTFDKPDRVSDCPAEWCGKFKQHGPHTWVPRAREVDAGVRRHRMGEAK